MTQRAVPVGIAAMAAVLAALLTGLLSTVLASSAQAASYRYWTYWTGTSDSWTFGSAGPAFTLPEDGDVEGWSFRVSTTDGTADAAPTTPPAFDALCGDITAENGLKRVGLVIDPGPASIAPDGETPINPIVTCVVMESDATGYDVLRSVVEVRTDNGLMCGLGGYPSSECAPVLDDTDVQQIADRASSDAGDVAAAEPASRAVEDSAAAAGGEAPQTSPLPTLIVILGIAVVGGAIVLATRRGRGRA